MNLGKRFLITTALQASWGNEEKIIFLGEWCRLFSQKKLYIDIDQKVLPYHWDDRLKYHRDDEYLTGLYERHLCNLSKRLGTIHNHTQDLRYWRIIVGPWLRYFIDAIYDRYETIRVAYESGEIENTWILKYDINSWVPDDFSEFYSQFVDDPWNHIIYGECIRVIKLPFTVIDVNLQREISGKKKSSAVRNFIGGLHSLVWKFIPRKLNKVSIISSYMPKFQLCKLQSLLGQAPYLLSPSVHISSSTNDSNLRLLLKDNAIGNNFENLLNTLIPQLIPRSYVENFVQLNSWALNVFPKNPEIILTANAYQSDEGFKIWAAHYAKLGVPLIIQQHGGNFGIGRDNQSEKHQIKIADSFISWGWVDRRHKSITPMPALKLTSPNPRPSQSGEILVTMASFPRYFYCFISFPVAGQFLSYINDQIKLFSHLSSAARNRLRVRVDADHFGWSIKERLLQHSSLDLNIETSKVNLRKRLNGCCLSVSTYNATIFLETMASNFPTLVFLSPNYFEVRPQSKELMDALRSVGILHDSFQTAAEFINENFENVMQWWMSDDVQATRAIFCDRYARTSNNWAIEWCSLLKRF
jgi:putative transferase (TIGR04331 family)